MHIESGPTTERKVRNCLLLAMVACFAVWFAYDGLVGYPKDNLKKWIESIPAGERDKLQDAQANPKVNLDNAEILLTAIQSDNTSRTAVFSSGTLTDKKAYLATFLGGPPTFESDKTFYYLGPALVMRFDAGPGSDLKMSLVKTQHSETDLKYQKGLAIGLGIFSIYIAFFLMRVWRTHAVLDDSGLTYNHRRKIPWVTMKALETSRFNEKGYVDLVWDNHGQEDELRLDEYHLAQFNDILTAICEKRGFENPLTKSGDDEPPAEDGAASSAPAS